MTQPASDGADAPGGRPQRADRVVATGRDRPRTGVRPDADVLATGSEDRTVRLYEVAGGGGVREPALLAGHAKPVDALAFSPDGQVLATGRGLDRASVGRRHRACRLPDL
ncbi:hypothetical protein [Streptomyces sp. NPDC005970]|uniref:WD40 repeat domain-containing protein n=1 Tax=Streptomyces sp. NPDC005970 TaxID=3156723 RepID=UPI0034075822